MKRLTPVFLLLIALFTSCDKFEQGGYHYQSAKNIRGIWKYSQVIVNDENVSDSVFYARYRNSFIEFEEGSLVNFYWYDVDSLVNEQTATYVFNPNKTQLNIVFDVYPFEDEVWQMEKLTKDELWFSYLTENEDFYYIKLKKQ